MSTWDSPEISGIFKKYIVLDGDKLPRSFNRDFEYVLNSSPPQVLQEILSVSFQHSQEQFLSGLLMPLLEYLDGDVRAKLVLNEMPLTTKAIDDICESLVGTPTVLMNLDSQVRGKIMNSIAHFWYPRYGPDVDRILLPKVQVDQTPDLIPQRSNKPKLRRDLLGRFPFPPAPNSKDTGWAKDDGWGHDIPDEFDDQLQSPSKITTQSRSILVTGHTQSGKLVKTFVPTKSYQLRFRVAGTSPENLAQGNVDVTGVPETGLEGRWIVASSNVEFTAINSDGKIEKRGKTYLAEFDLWIPGQGDSKTVALDIRTTDSRGELSLSILVNGEEYRKVSIGLSAGPEVANDVVCTALGHLNLKPSHEWTTPPEHIEVNVFGNAARVTTIVGANEYGTLDWVGNSTRLKNPIQRVRDALEKFRILAEVHLNNLDVSDIVARLGKGGWKPYDWNSFPQNADEARKTDFTKYVASDELRALANDGYRLFSTCFPVGSELRLIIENLKPGSRIDFNWTSRGAVDWVSHVPWLLMYMDPIKSSEPVNCERFLGLRYRIGSKSWEPRAPSRALGDESQVNLLNFLYWGDNPKDEVAVQSQWQRQTFSNWSNQHFVPSSQSKDRKREVISALETPKPDPAGVLYFFCHCSVKDGSDPILQFGESGKALDIVEASDLYQGRLESGPLVFANACSTVAADPQGTSELEQRFFDRDIRAFIGTETKVPVTLASRFAWLFFQFFLRKVDKSPMAAGEALTQARLFLWTQYRNPGGLFYCLVNQYNLYLASSEEVTQLQRK